MLFEMADKDMFFLVQWEDRFMSIIEKKTIVSPLKAQDKYNDGELIIAEYGQKKQKKRYEAVICEIHPNKKFLTEQAKLPPKITFFEAKRLQSVEKRSDAPAVIQQVVPSSVKPAEKLKLSDVPAVNKDAPAVNRHVVPSSVKPVSEDVPGSPSTSTSHKVKKLPDEPTMDKHVPVVVPSDKPKMNNVGLHSPVSKSKKDSGWEDECSRMRRKMRKLEDRVSEIEKKIPKLGSEEDEAIMELVAHLSADRHIEVVSVLAKHFFTIEELKNHSRTGKKTVKCSGEPRPALDAAKLFKVERLSMTKTGMMKSEFVKKFENVQKLLRRK